MKPGPDPYRVLGVQRGADLRQIRAAHRRLAKRFHPDAAGGETERFLAIQEAYQLLSDPLRRRDWDRRHAPGPSETGARPRPGAPAPTARAAQGRRAEPSSAGAERTSRQHRGTDRDPGPETGSGRDPGTRRHTWSAAGVPWWEDFTPKARGAGRAAPGGGGAGRAAPGGGGAAPAPAGGAADPAAGAATPAAEGTAAASGGGPLQGAAADGDAPLRSSGAAWSMAARRHFRRGDAELPSGGAFRYRGTQVVTGAEARKVAAEEEASGKRATDAVSRRKSGVSGFVARLRRRARPGPPGES